MKGKARLRRAKVGYNFMAPVLRNPQQDMPVVDNDRSSVDSPQSESEEFAASAGGEEEDFLSTPSPPPHHQVGQKKQKAAKIYYGTLNPTVFGQALFQAKHSVTNEQVDDMSNMGSIQDFNGKLMLKSDQIENRIRQLFPTRKVFQQKVSIKTKGQPIEGESTYGYFSVLEILKSELQLPGVLDSLGPPGGRLGKGAQRGSSGVQDGLLFKTHPSFALLFFKAADGNRFWLGNNHLCRRTRIIYHIWQIYTNRTRQIPQLEVTLLPFYKQASSKELVLDMRKKSQLTLKASNGFFLDLGRPVRVFVEGGFLVSNHEYVCSKVHVEGKKLNARFTFFLCCRCRS